MMRRLVGIGMLASVACAGPRTEIDRSAARTDRVIAGLMPQVSVKGRPAVRYRLADRMAALHVPGISVAVADSGRIVWARGFGLKETGTSDSVTPSTLFQAASISKPVAATAMLRLVQDGKLDLDKDVNAYLTSWKLPGNRFTAKDTVTLRRIVSHNAGLTVHGFPGYAVTDSIPSVPEILDGAKPANTAPVRVDTFPGAIWRYSGGGITIEQLVMTDVTGEPFPALMKVLVLDPAGMTSSTYQQPLPEDRRSEAATGYRPDGTMIAGHWHVYPEMAAAGLWTTPTDLLKWAFAVAAAREGAPEAILSKPIATEMLTVQKAPTGLGPFLAGSGKGFNFGHGGANEGFRSQVIYFPETGQGAAVMANSDAGSEVIQELLYAIGAEYGWPDYHPRVIEPVAMDSAGLAPFLGDYAGGSPPAEAHVTVDGGRVYLEVPKYLPKDEIVFTGPTKATSLGGLDLEFERDAAGRVVGIRLGDVRLTRKP